MLPRFQDSWSPDSFWFSDFCILNLVSILAFSRFSDRYQTLLWFRAEQPQSWSRGTMVYPCFNSQEQDCFVYFTKVLARLAGSIWEKLFCQMTWAWLALCCSELNQGLLSLIRKLRLRQVLMLAGQNGSISNLGNKLIVFYSNWFSISPKCALWLD